MSTVIHHNSDSLVSVVIPAYNAGCYLLPAVESVLEQTYSNIEIFVIDDGSTDDSIASLGKINDKRLSIIRQSNMGKPATLNKALLDMVKGEFFVVQDADDLSKPMRIEEMVKIMTANSDIAILFSGYDLIVEGKSMAPSFGDLDRDECKAKVDAFKMPGHDPTAMMRTSIAKQFLYNPDLRIGEGLDIILRIGEKYPIMKLGQCLYSYRVSFNSLTRLNIEKRNKYVEQVLDAAYQRRGIKKMLVKQPSKIQPYQFDNNIAAQFMESAIDLRKQGSLLKAFVTGLQCIRLNPSSAHYYKALVYAILPEFVSRAIRKRSGK